MCDRLVVATEPLRDAYRKLIGDIVVVPNYLESGRWEGLQSVHREGARPRVGWAGSVSHGGDLALLQQVMRELASEADFVLFGMCPQALKPYVREFHPAVPFDAYPARLASLGLDLAIAPLEINAFNAAKSNLRILEYGILGWPVVCTDIEPYRGAPVRCVRNRPEEWVEAIREHLHDLSAARAGRRKTAQVGAGSLDARRPPRRMAGGAYRFPQSLITSVKNSEFRIQNSESTELRVCE